MTSFDDIERSRREIEALRAQQEHEQWLFRVAARHHRDQADAAQVQAIRDCGAAVGQRREYNKRAKRLERKLGY